MVVVVPSDLNSKLMITRNLYNSEKEEKEEKEMWIFIIWLLISPVHFCNKIQHNINIIT